MGFVKMSGGRFINGMTWYAAEPERAVRVFYVGRLMICWFGRKDAARLLERDDR